MSLLDGILNEPANDLDVVIVNEDDLNGALEELGRLAPRDPRRKKFVRRVRKGLISIPKRGRNLSTKDLTPKAEFEKRIHMLPSNLQRELKNSRLQIVDGNIYSMKSISEKSQIELLENKDDKTVGLTNMNSRKLDANQYFLVVAIQLMYCADAGGTTDNHLKEADYKDALPAIIKNGEFTMELGTEVLIPEISGEIFNTSDRLDLPQGYYKLSNPKWLKPLTEIIPEMKMTGVGPVNSAVKFHLIGATVAKL